MKDVKCYVCGSKKQVCFLDFTTPKPTMGDRYYLYTLCRECLRDVEGDVELKKEIWEEEKKAYYE